MQLIVSRSHPAIDAQTLAEYVTRDALFRAADGSYFLYMTSMGRVEGEERILFLIAGTHCFGSMRLPTRSGHIGISPNTRNGAIVRKPSPRTPFFNVLPSPGPDYTVTCDLQ